MPNTIHPFVVELARNQHAVDKILRTHRADERNRCEGCYLDDRMRPQWPCLLHGCATRARLIIDQAEDRAGLLHVG